MIHTVSGNRTYRSVWEFQGILLNQGDKGRIVELDEISSSFIGITRVGQQHVSIHMGGWLWLKTIAPHDFCKTPLWTHNLRKEKRSMMHNYCWHASNLSIRIPLKQRRQCTWWSDPSAGFWAIPANSSEQPVGSKSRFCEEFRPELLGSCKCLGAE